MMRDKAWLVGVVGMLLALAGCAPPTARLASLGNGVCRDTVTGLMWQVGRSGEFASLAEAAAYARGLSLGGYADWRLPTNDELYTLHDILAVGLAGDCALPEHGSYWATTGTGRGEAGFWETYPLCGGDGYVFRKRKGGVVRAVRP